MKKLIPFKKEIKFDTNLYEVTSISLEHTLHKEEESISGNFIVSGEYRITETSSNTLSFSYDLPFTIDIDSKYNIDNVIIDINDFYYEIVDNKYLVINIEVKLDHIEEILEAIPVLEREEEVINIMPKEDVIEPTYDEIPEIPQVKEDNIEVKDKVKSLFSNMESMDNYVSYKVYIVRENDTLESIITKYNVSKENIELYNDISELKIGDKVIIPYVKNQ